MAHRLVGGAVAVGKKAGHAAHEFDRQAGNADIGADKFKGAHGQESSQGMGDGDAPAQGQPGGDTNHGLFGDACINKPAGELVRQISYSSPIFSGHHHVPLVG